VYGEAVYLVTAERFTNNSPPARALDVRSTQKIIEGRVDSEASACSPTSAPSYPPSQKTPQKPGLPRKVEPTRPPFSYM
jgi:hypothetical protein